MGCRMNDLRRIALDLYDAGILTFPATAEAKHPDRGERHRDESGERKPRWGAAHYPPNGWPTRERHIAMFAQREVARMFVVTGSRSNGTVCLDFDERGVLPALARHVSASIGERLYIEQSQRSGRRHVVFRVADAPSRSVPARTVDGEIRIEIRGEGNGFIAAPSVGYARIQGSLLDLPFLSASEFDALVSAARTFNQYVPEPPPPVNQRVSPVRFVHDASTQIVNRDCHRGSNDRPGDHYNATHGQADVVVLLEKHCWTVVGQRGTCVDVRRPGNTEHAVSGNVNADGVLIVFSTATVFNAGAPYAPFDVLVALEYRGDYRAAARDLAPGERQQCDSRLHPRVITFDDQRRILPARMISLD